MFLCKLLLLTIIGGTFAAPADHPERVDLPVYEAKTLNPVVPENHPGLKIHVPTGSSLIANKVSALTNILSSKTAASPHQQTGFASGIFNAPTKYRENALPEIEGWGSKTLSVKENVQNIVAGLLQPKPIVDTINEEDKYGNSGDKFYGIGRAVVGSASAVSSLVNNALEVPGNIFKQITRVASEKLNNLGGKLIGLN